MTAPPTTGSGKTANQSSGGRFEVTTIEPSDRSFIAQGVEELGLPLVVEPEGEVIQD